MIHKVETRYQFRSSTPAGRQGFETERAKLPRVGVYGGSFDPVHAGHIAFALKAQKLAGLERIYFVPERRPQRAVDPEHHTHRSRMLEEALRPYPQFESFTVPDAHLNKRSLHRLATSLPPAQLSLLVTAHDVLLLDDELPSQYRSTPLVVAVASHAQMAETLARLTANERLFTSITFIDTSSDHINSAKIRHGLRTGTPVYGALASVQSYARKQWLYVPTIRHHA